MVDMTFTSEEGDMTIDQMRLYISQHAKYKSPEWTEKVTNMPDNQVIAIYKKFKQNEPTYKGEATEVFDKPRIGAGYWKCNSCDLKPVCNVFESHDASKPILECSGYVEEKDEEE